LFSSESLQDVRRLYDEIEPIWLEKYIPESLRSRLRPALRRLTHEQDDRRLMAIVWPLRLQVFAILIYTISLYGSSVLSRRFWAAVAITLGIISVTWLLMRVGDTATDLLTRRLLRLNRTVDIMLVRLSNRLGKAALAIVCALLLLRLSGFDLTAVLTGLGLGGVAIAFAAQKTLENLFGGMCRGGHRPEVHAPADPGANHCFHPQRSTVHNESGKFYLPRSDSIPAHDWPSL
jgi:hypothetical protein